jgi:hypothetical protein
MPTPMHDLLAPAVVCADQQGSALARREAVLDRMSRMAAAAVTTAFVVAVSGAIFLTYFFAMSALMLLGMCFFIWDGVMLASALIIARFGPNRVLVVADRRCISRRWGASRP